MDREAGRQALRKLEELWRAKRGARPLPKRREFDFRDFKPWIGRIRIIEVLPETPPRFRVTLDGAEIVNTAGVDMTGRFLDVTYGSENLRFLLDGYHKVIATGEAVYETLHPNGRIVNFGEIIRLLLPCGEDRRVEHIIYCEYAYDVLHWGRTVFADVRDLNL
jgi:hypothetical protein